MPRYIDADKLAEYITTNYCKNCDIYDGEKCCSCPMNDALNYIETFQTADVAPRAEWISVEERIPKNFESVLVLATRLEDDEYDVLVAYHDRGDWEEQHTRRYESPICGEIKYWMPLPEPLKGE